MFGVEHRDTAEADPLVVLGSGYAGLTVAHRVWHRSRGEVRIVLVDRHPTHVLRTELYEVGRMAAERDSRHWAIPLSDVLENTSVEYREGTVTSIDLASRKVGVGSAEVPFGQLAIALGSAPSYYGVPGAADHTHQVYSLRGARQLTNALSRLESTSDLLPPQRRPRVVVIGGGSTGTELAAEIATTDWSRVTTRGARAPEVVLVTGAFPFLAGLSDSLLRRVLALLREAGVALLRGVNVTGVEPGRLRLEDGTVLAFDLAVWCAGVVAPPLVSALPVPHGSGGRITVGPTLEIPRHPGVYALGDAAEVRDPRSGRPVPATAQAAVAEARVVAENVIARFQDRAPHPFLYRERGALLAVGAHRGAVRIGPVTLGGRPASWLKRFVENEYARSIVRGEPSSLL